MLQYEIEIAEQAEKDLNNILEYISIELQVPEIAVAQLKRIQENILALAKIPERGALVKKEPWKSRQIRFLPVDHFLVYYFVQKTEQKVLIVRVLYGRRDQEKQLTMIKEETVIEDKNYVV